METKIPHVLQVVVLRRVSLRLAKQGEQLPPLCQHCKELPSSWVLSERSCWEGPNMQIPKNEET